MIGAVRSWLLAVISVSLLCAVAGALMPQGGVKRVGRLVCGLVLLAAVLSPLTELDVEAGQRWLASFMADVSGQEAELRETVNSQMKTIIEQKYAAYIVDKATRLGLTCSARVECRETEEGLYLPVRAEVTGSWTVGAQDRLSQVLSEDLGIPAQSQIYINEEEAR